MSRSPDQVGSIIFYEKSVELQQWVEKKDREEFDRQKQDREL